MPSEASESPSVNQDLAKKIAENWRTVRDDVDEACRVAGRDPDAVRIIGVSKYVDAATTQHLIDAGCNDLGENRPQVLWQKAETLRLPNHFRWHQIGHVQTNKVRRLLRHNPLIHSIDSEKLLVAISEEAASQGRDIEGLVEINISGESAKTGLMPEAARELLAKLRREPESIRHLRITGLMAMAGWKTSPEAAGQQFRQLADLRGELQSVFDHELPELSMGMTGDFREAIAAGATMVRIGSALFPPELRG